MTFGTIGSLSLPQLEKLLNAATETARAKMKEMLENLAALSDSHQIEAKRWMTKSIKQASGHTCEAEDFLSWAVSNSTECQAALARGAILWAEQTAKTDPWNEPELRSISLCGRRAEDAFRCASICLAELSKREVGATVAWSSAFCYSTLPSVA